MLSADGGGVVLDRAGGILRAQGARWFWTDNTATFDEDAASAGIDHHLGNVRINQQVLDRPEKRQNAFEATHDRWLCSGVATRPAAACPSQPGARPSVRDTTRCSGASRAQARAQ